MFAAAAARSGSELVAVNVNTSDPSLTDTDSDGSPPTVLRTSVSSSEPFAACSSFSTRRGLNTSPVDPREYAVAGVFTNTCALARYIGVCAIDNPIATSVVSTTGRITIHLRRQTTDA